MYIYNIYIYIHIYLHIAFYRITTELTLQRTFDSIISFGQ